MSLSRNEERPILRGKRFNKFEQSSSVPEIEDDNSNVNVTRKGSKRAGTEVDGNDLSKFKRKRIYPPINFDISPNTLNRGLNTLTPPAKNLANNRLKKLKEQIKSSANTSQIEDNVKDTVAEKACLEKNYLTRSVDSLYNSDKNLKYEHYDSYYLNTVTTSLNLSKTKKNLAEERLQIIKKKLNSTYPYSTPSKEKEMPQCSSWKDDENKMNTSVRRNITNITNTCNYNLSANNSPMCKKPRNSYSPERNIVTTSRPESNQDNFTSKERGSFGSTPISKPMPNTNDTNIGRTNISPNINTAQHLETPKLKSGSEAYKNCDTLRPRNKITKNSLPIDSRSNFLSKMEMTASWIRNHQINNTFIPSTPPEDIISDKVIETNARFDDETEYMEWTNAEPDDEVVDPNKNLDQTATKDDDNTTEVSTGVVEIPEKLKDVCVVVDTNVFISGLSKIRDILNLKTGGSFKPIIYVPWMVITELDYMKDSCSDSKLSKNIMNAIKFINTALSDSNPQVIGQTVFEVEKQKFIGSSPDDKIISCCLQVAEKYENVILLSNDMNLKNKAMINDITACSSNEVMIKLVSKLVKNTKSQKIMHKLGILCSSIICDCMKAAYGDVWSKMDMMKNPPWSLVECLRRFKKYWSSVFSEKLMKQFIKAVHDLRSLLETNKYIADNSDEFIQFMKLSISLCIFLKDMDECRGFVENTIADITKIA